LSIKTLYALAFGRPFASTRAGLRGLKLDDTGVKGAETAAEFAADIVQLLDSADAQRVRAKAARRLYELNFSKRAYTDAWDHTIAHVAPEFTAIIADSSH